MDGKAKDLENSYSKHRRTNDTDNTLITYTVELEVANFYRGQLDNLRLPLCSTVALGQKPLELLWKKAFLFVKIFTPNEN